MQEVSFEEVLALILLKDPRYHRDAYLFVREALDHTQKGLSRQEKGEVRHVSGQELLAGIREFALAHYGPMTMMVLGEWGIHHCRDFGEIVFNMVETGGAPAFAVGDVKDPLALAQKLTAHPDPLSEFVWNRLPGQSREAVLTTTSSNPEHLERALVDALNRVIKEDSLYRAEKFAGVALSKETRSLIGLNLKGTLLARLNRLLLEDAFPGEIARSHGLLAKTEKDSRADFDDGYDFFEVFRKPFLPPSKQAASDAALARSYTI
jgi:uncharacterized repeat protein (TIGR04138 family)